MIELRDGVKLHNTVFQGGNDVCKFQLVYYPARVCDYLTSVKGFIGVCNGTDIKYNKPNRAKRSFEEIIPVNVNYFSLIQTI